MRSSSTEFETLPTPRSCALPYREAGGAWESARTLLDLHHRPAPNTPVASAPTSSSPTTRFYLVDTSLHTSPSSGTTTRGAPMFKLVAEVRTTVHIVTRYSCAFVGPVVAQLLLCTVYECPIVCHSRTCVCKGCCSHESGESTASCSQARGLFSL